MLITALLLLSTIASAIQILSEVTRPVMPKNITDCRPACLNKNSYQEGWYYYCNNTFIKYAKCIDCGPACMNARNVFEGWYDTCSGLLIKLADCNTTVQKTYALQLFTTTTRVTTITTSMSFTTTTPSWLTTMVGAPQSGASYGTTVGAPQSGASYGTTVGPSYGTTTTTIPQYGCQPVCLKKTPALKGWFDSCTGNFLKRAYCTHCKPICLKDKKIEGWYDGCNSKFIAAATCV